MLRTLIRGVGLGLFLLFAACATQMDLPKDFLQLSESEQFRAVTGDDARVWIREFEDENAASREFWAQAVEYDFVQQRGYELIAKGEVKNRSGVAGDWFECATNVGGARYGYLVAIWVSGTNIKVVEFTARDEVWKARVESVRAALRTVRG
ncbi:MAG: hypothetical protein IT456_12140 [Planctomycetes bacterium]|nr:hypothetical protein [Planctomycetota bacterium]